MTRAEEETTDRLYHDHGIFPDMTVATNKAATFAAMEGMEKPRKTGWMARLSERWKVTPTQVLVILLVFACTGTTVLFLKRPVVAFFAGEGEQPLLFSILYYILILPVYNAILLVYGFLFGQFKFFWEFEKRTFRRMTGKR